MGEFEEHGIKYSANYENLVGTTSIKTANISSRTKRIKGYDKQTYSFINAAATLTSFTFGRDPQLEVIESYSFYSCSQLASIDLSSCSKLNTIGSYAFALCNTVTTILLPSNLIHCAEYCFSETNVAKIQIPSSLVYLDEAVFCFCKQLKEITINEDSNLTSILWRVFHSNPITSIFIPSKVSSFSASAFEWGSKMKTAVVSLDNAKYVSVDGVVYSKNMKEILYFPATNCINYTIPDGVVSVVGSAFTSAFIQYITFPLSLERIQGYAFCNTKLKSIILPPRLLSIDVCAFDGIASLTQVDFSKAMSLTTIGPFAFARTGLREIILPPAVKTIGDSCFTSCWQLGKVVLPKNLTSLGGGVFTSCPSSLILEFDPEANLKINSQYLITDKDQSEVIQYMNSEPNQTVFIPSNVVTIKAYSFQYKTNLLCVIFNGTIIQKIEKGAFSKCSNLATISFPSSLIYILNEAFSYCSSIKSLEFGHNLNSIYENSFYNCKSLESVRFISCQRILQGAFQYCSKLITRMSKQIGQNNGIVKTLRGKKKLHFFESRAVLLRDV